MLLCNNVFAEDSQNINTDKDLSIFLARQIKQLDLKNLILPEKITKDNITDYTFIDVRSKEKFDENHILNSLNIPLNQIKTKSFLKSNKILIYNDGDVYYPIIEEVERLKSQGFNVWILTGGLNKVIISGHSFIKSDNNKINNKIPVDVFFTEKDFSHWLFINTETINDKNNFLVPYSVSIPFDVKNEGQLFATKLSDEILKIKDSSIINILIFNNDGKNYEQIDKTLSNFKYNIFYLNEGLEEYKNFLLNQQLLQNPKTQKNEPCREC